MIQHETIDEYLSGRVMLESKGITLSAIVLDGKPGIRKLFLDIPVQMCHFHQKQIIQRYLTSSPKLEAGIELRKILTTLCTTDAKTFTRKLNSWHKKWDKFLKERTSNPSAGFWYYTHRGVRSAYRSLKTNLPYLFTYKNYPDLNIPNTTNSLDGCFGHLKPKLKIHRGLNSKLKRKIIEYILQN